MKDLSTVGQSNIYALKWTETDMICESESQKKVSLERMREILFRGKRIDNGEWVYWNCYGEFCRESGKRTKVIITRASGESYYYHLYQITSMIRPETIGQYTGLKDKNGKRIFEGDICQNIKTGEIVSAKWHGTMAGFVWVVHQGNGHNFDFGELFRAYDKYKIIGNIDDNPELLEV